MGRVNTIGNSKMQQCFSRNFSQKGLIENIGLKYQTVSNIVEDLCIKIGKDLYSQYIVVIKYGLYELV